MKSLSPQALTSPLRMQLDLFTSLSRTPWAGTGLGRFKQHLRPNFPSARVPDRVGESWEFSSDPTMPSGFRDFAGTLVEALDKWPREILGPAHVSEGCRLLVKLISAEIPLSFQLHPEDHDPALQVGECGKPESWFILHAEPEARIYLGFKAGTSFEDFAKRLQSGEDVAAYMQFVPVKAGDFYDIPPHVPHAIGGGVTLLEPQRILPGLSGKTYRLWDWGRRYDKSGELAPISGETRQLHVDACLRLIDPAKQCGRAFVESLFREPKSIYTSEDLSVFDFRANEHYRLLKIAKSQGRQSQVQISVPDGYAVIFLSQGMVCWSEAASDRCQAGESLLLPNAATPATFSGFTWSPDSCEMLVMLQGSDQLSIRGQLV